MAMSPPSSVFAQQCVDGDSNGDGALDLSDAVHILLHLFAGGPAPARCPELLELQVRVQALESELAGCQAMLDAARLANDRLETELEQVHQRLDGSWFQWPVEEDGNGHWYRFTSPGTWSEVQAEALRAGGHLVVINDAGEQGWLNEQFPPTERDPNLWIGLKQDLTDPAAQGLDPLNNGTAGNPVVRGGGWDSVAEDCRSARRRDHGGPASDVGFRPVFNLR
jgi:hypothetical protein